MSEATSTGVRADLGLWSRLRHTPLRDIVRGRATGRLNVRHMIEQAGLPRPIGDLVMRIVRASRLTRLERVDVAEELIAHFRDGLDAGANPDTLIEAFGDIYLSGRLIRRAKKCLRPMWWQVMARGTTNRPMTAPAPLAQAVYLPRNDATAVSSWSKAVLMASSDMKCKP